MTVEEALLSVSPLAFGGAFAAGLGLVIGWRRYQRCPHCGRLAPRAWDGWKRCRRCGRQYRKGLRLR